MAEIRVFVCDKDVSAPGTAAPTTVTDIDSAATAEGFINGLGGAILFKGKADFQVFYVTGKAAPHCGAIDKHVVVGKLP